MAGLDNVGVRFRNDVVMAAAGLTVVLGKSEPSLVEEYLAFFINPKRAIDIGNDRVPEECDQISLCRRRSQAIDRTVRQHYPDLPSFSMRTIDKFKPVRVH